MNDDMAARALEHVLITGATSGIGRACAQKLIARGVRVSVLDITPPDYDVAAFEQLDLSDPASITQALSAVQALDPIDALFNIAGVPPKPDQQKSILCINWAGQVMLTKGLLDRIRAGGAIVNMASKAGGRWMQNIEEVRHLMAHLTPDQIDDFLAETDIDATRAYNLSKEALIVWTMASAKALKDRQLRMNCVSPAAVDTGILDDFKTAFGPMVDKNLAMTGRPGHPEEVADVALFLASPESYWLRGVDITVDGGMSAFMQTEQLKLDDTLLQ